MSSLYVPEKLQYTAEGPDLNSEIRIIAVEFAIRHPAMSEVELEMFPCRHTLKRDHAYQEVRFTLHCSDGDRTIRQTIRF